QSRAQHGIEATAEKNEQDKGGSQRSGDDQRREHGATSRGRTPVRAGAADRVHDSVPIHRGDGCPRRAFRRCVRVGDHQQPARPGEALASGIALRDPEGPRIERRIACYGRDAFRNPPRAFLRGEHGPAAHPEQGCAVQNYGRGERLLGFDIEGRCLDWGSRSEDNGPGKNGREAVHGARSLHGTSDASGAARSPDIGLQSYPVRAGAASAAISKRPAIRTRSGSDRAFIFSTTRARCTLIVFSQTPSSQATSLLISPETTSAK